MSFSLPAGTRATHTRPAWSGMAMLVEAMLLLVFLMTSLAIAMQLFAASSSRAQQGRDLSRAVAEATNVAERFAADPSTAGGVTQADDLTIDCQVTDEDTARGTLYHATITVFADDAKTPVYVLTTARYEQGVG